MAEYIDREELIQELDAKLRTLHGELDENRIVYDAFTDGFEECVGEMGKFQFAADVALVVHGRWVEYPRPHYFKCSECKYTVPYRKAMWFNGKREYNYCPNCGAKMDGGAE